MSDDEIRELLQQLIPVLRQNNLGWLVRQVAQSLTDEDISEFDDLEILNLVLQTNRPAVSLERLLKALGIAIVETAEMEREVRNFFVNDNFIRGQIFYGRRTQQNYRDYPQTEYLETEDVISPQRLDSEERRKSSSNLSNLIKNIRMYIS